MEIDNTTELKNEDQIEIEADAKEFEFVIPLHSLVKLRPFVDRYFVKYYQTYQSIFNNGFTGNQYAFCHTNKLFMVGIAKEHEIVTQRIKVKKVTFGTFGEGNALSVKGKKKKGGIRVKMGQKMCEILTEDGRIFPLKSLVDGHVIEINDAVENDPNILLDYPESKGYIAIINCGVKIERECKSLIPEAQYRELLLTKGTEASKGEAMIEEKP